MEFIIGLILIGFFLMMVIYGAIFFVLAMAYGYWGLSIGMAPVLWLIMLIGAINGLVCAIRNAFKAVSVIRAEKGK